MHNLCQRVKVKYAQKVVRVYILINAGRMSKFFYKTALRREKCCSTEGILVLSRLEILLTLFQRFAILKLNKALLSHFQQNVWKQWL